jgi:hypothetical protein
VCLTVSHRVRAMVEKPIFLGELAPRRNVGRPGHRASLLVVTGVALQLFVGETVGTAEEQPTMTQGSAPRPSSASETSGSGSDRSSIDRAGPSGISDAGQPSPGQWLIDDVARDRAKSGVERVSPNPTPATMTTPDAAPVEADIGSRSLDDTRTGEHQRGREETTGSIGRPPTVELGDPPSSASGAGSMRTDADDGRLSAPPPHRSSKRSDARRASTRHSASLGLDDAATKCVQAPVGRAPEGEHWYYRLNRERHRKCWYVRGHR